MSTFRVSASKRGGVTIMIKDALVERWVGYTFTDAEARQLARDLCKAVGTTAADLTADKTTEP